VEFREAVFSASRQQEIGQYPQLGVPLLHYKNRLNNMVVNLFGVIVVTNNLTLKASGYRG